MEFAEEDAEACRAEWQYWASKAQAYRVREQAMLTSLEAMPCFWSHRACLVVLDIAFQHL